MPYVATGPNGERKAWNGETWVDLPRTEAAGGRYLPSNIGKPDKSEAANFNKWRTDQEPGVQNARSAMAQDREMEGLLERQKTGGIYAVPVVGDVAGMFDPEIRRMEGLQSEAARSKRVPGEGTISDFDAKMFLAQTFGKGQPTETNRAIIKADRLRSDAAIQRRAMADWYYQTYGNRVGFDEAWDRYTQDNPIFDPASESAGKPVLNAGRQNWRQYFGAVRGEGDERSSEAQADIERSGKAGVPNTARDAWKARLSAGKIDQAAKVGTAKHPYLARDEETLNRLPKGSYAVAPDGSFGQVR